MRAPACRKLLLTAHVATAASVLGTDRALGTLGIAGLRGAEPQTVGPAARLLGARLVAPLAQTSRQPRQAAMAACCTTSETEEYGHVTSAREIVEHYFGAFWSGDAQTARHYLADDLSYSAPGAAIRTADIYLKASEHARRGVAGVEKHKVFADGPDVCIFYNLLFEGPVGSAAVAEWYHLDGGKIASIRTILDTAPFAAGAREQAGETAIDPVCHMTVAKASAAATRSYGSVTYYFCNPGCAEAFEQEPEKYYLTSSRR